MLSGTDKGKFTVLIGDIGFMYGRPEDNNDSLWRVKYLVNPPYGDFGNALVPSSDADAFVFNDNFNNESINNLHQSDGGQIEFAV